MSKLGDEIHTAMVRGESPVYTAEMARADAKLVIDEQQDEIDALRSHIAGANLRRDQRTAALFCVAAVLGVASAGPPLLLLLAFVAAGAGIVSVRRAKVKKDCHKCKVPLVQSGTEAGPRPTVRLRGSTARPSQFRSWRCPQCRKTRAVEALDV